MTQEPPVETQKQPESTTTEPADSPLSDAEKRERLEADRHRAIEAKEKHDHIKKLWEQSHVPHRHRLMASRAALADQPEQRAGWNEKMAAILAKLDQGIIAVLHGPRGTGKTQMGACLIREACLLGEPSYFTTAMGFFLHVRSSYGGGPDSERAVVAAYLSPTVLVIDEMHERGNTDWEDRLLGHLVNERYAAMRSTILITNQTVDAAAKSLGTSITDRVRECGWFVECDWPSFRGVAEP
jgi:DNA replication protein DnaC